ncbi:MAG: signal peptidase I [Lachnospiraceae bacterium]
MGKIIISDRFKINLFEILKTVFVCLFILLLFFAVRVYLIQPVSVKGASMEPSIEDGDILLINKIGNKLKYERFEVIVFRPYSEDDLNTTDEDESRLLYIKRIIGLPGETVTVLSDGRIQINSTDGQTFLLSDEYGQGSAPRGINWVIDDDNTFETITLDTDEYFVLGDNRDVSLDSRSSKIQAVHANSIIGRYIIRVYPLF